MKKLILILLLIPSLLFGQPILYDEHPVDSCYTFNGSDEYIAIDEIDLGTVHSVSAWVNFNDADYNVVAGDASTSSYSYFMLIYNGSIYYHDGANFQSWTHGLQTGEWAHIVVTRNGTSVNCYINGASQGAKSLASNNDAILSAIGQRRATWYFDGEIKEVAFWDTVLTLEDAQALYNSGTPINAMDAVWYPFNTVAYYPMNTYGFIEYGDNTVTNGTFDTDTDWTKGTNVTISGGTANYASGSTFPGLQQTQTGVLIGGEYRINIDVTTYTSGDVLLIRGGSGTQEYFGITGTGTYSLTGKWDGTNNILYLRGDAGSFIGSIDNITVRPLRKVKDWSGTTYNSVGVNIDNTNVVASGFGNTKNIASSTHSIDSAFTFNGSDEEVQIGLNRVLDLEIGEDKSISLWLRGESGNTARLGIIGGYVENQWLQHYDNDYISCYLKDDNANIMSTNAGSIDVRDGNWHHIIISLDYDGDLTYFIDGAFANSQACPFNTTLTASSASVVETIGRTYTTRYFDGDLKEVSIWNRALTLADAQALYNDGIPIKATDAIWYPLNCLAYYPMNTLENGKVNDISGNSYNGTLVNIDNTNVVVSGFGNTSRILTSFDVCTEYFAVYEEMTTTPSYEDAMIQNQFVETLVDNGIWDKLDLLYITAQPNATDALLNWISPGDYTATVTGSPTFIAYEGYTGVSPSTLNTGWTFANSRFPYSNQNESMGHYTRTTNSIGNASSIGAYDGSAYNMVYNNATNLGYAVNNTGSTISAVSDIDGCIIGTLTGTGTETTLFRNGSEIAQTSVVFPGSEPTSNVTLLAATNTFYSSEQVSMGFVGIYLTEAEVIILTNAFEAYMDSYGKGVID